MDSLPAELLDLIIAQCEHSALKNLRGVNRRYRNLSTPLVFEQFYMGMFEDSLDILFDLSKSPLAKHVKTFTFYSDVLPQWDRKTWEESIDNRPDGRFTEAIELPIRISAGTSKAQRPPWPYDENARLNWWDTVPRHQFTTKQLDRGWKAYRLMQKEQQRWGKDIRRLLFKEHFARFPNLVEATVAPTAPFQGRISKWPVWRRLREKMLVSPDDWIYSKENIGDGLPSYVRACTSGHAALVLLEAIGFRASFAGTKHINKLTVHTTHHGSFKHLMGYELERTAERRALGFESRFHEIGEGFRNIQQLDLRVPHAAKSNTVGGEAAGIEIVAILLASRRLRRLNLSYDDDDTGLSSLPYPATSSLAPLFTSSPRWKQLKYLSLSIDVPHTLLLPFFRTLSPSLKSLELRDMVVEDVGELISGIPKILHLEHVYLEGMFQRRTGDGFGCAFVDGSDVDRPYEKAIKAYLLGESGELPEMWWDVDGEDSEHEGVDLEMGDDEESE